MYNRTVNGRVVTSSARDTRLHIAESIRKTIQSKGYTERLPTVSEFAEMFAVSRGTIHRALHILKEEGLIEPVQGVAWYITGTVDTRPADIRVREALTELGFQKGQRILSETELAEHLGLSRITIRRGLAHLEGEGVVSAASPKGRTLL